jgi:allantoicase
MQRAPIRGDCACQESKQFFFEKKHQKTFTHIRLSQYVGGLSSPRTAPSRPATGRWHAAASRGSGIELS